MVSLYVFVLSVNVVSMYRVNSLLVLATGQHRFHTHPNKNILYITTRWYITHS